MVLQTSAGWLALTQIHKWMKEPLQYGILRVNTLRISPEEALERTRQSLAKSASLQGKPCPKAWLHPILTEAIIMTSWPGVKPLLNQRPDKLDLPKVVVDITCGNAVLRGAPVYKGGILAMSDNVSVGEPVQVQVFRDSVRKWIGNGIVRSSFTEGSETSRDCIVEVTEGPSVLPPAPRELVQNGLAVAQSIPSIITSRVLNPQKGERILDLGCGTGYMTTHIAALTSNEAEIIGVDQSASRLNTLIHRCQLLGAKVTLVESRAEDFVAKETAKFDRVLFHPDHSSNGARPNMIDFVTEGRAINYFIREEIERALDLLKPGGRLVFCTGSVIPIENEAVVRWVLDKRPDMKLVPAVPRLAPLGAKCPLPVASSFRLSSNEENLIQRFGRVSHDGESDPVIADTPGFFIACLEKTSV